MAGVINTGGRPRNYQTGVVPRDPNSLRSITKKLNYKQDADSIEDFFRRFAVPLHDDNLLNYEKQELAEILRPQEVEEARIHYKYLERMQEIAARKEHSITIDLDDLAKFEAETNLGTSLTDNIEMNAIRYVNIITGVICKSFPQEDVKPDSESDPLDVIIYQRRVRNRENAENPDQIDPAREFPSVLTRNFNVLLKPRSTMKPLPIRDVKGTNIGKLVRVQGVVTKTTNVKPMVLVLCLSCDKCGSEIFQEVASKEFLALVQCPSQTCKTNDSKGKLYMQTRASKFMKFQEVKLQESPEQVPMGHIPRTMTLHLYDDLVRTLTPGEGVLVSGIWLPTPYEGFKAIRAGLIADTFLQVQHIEKLKKSYDQMQLSKQVVQRLSDLISDGNLYNKLASSIAPEIYGHDDVKKALLLLLVGGATKVMPDGMKIRGDLNICLMGDPGVAKSQLLKFISKIAPRGIYTTGRGSSGVGLTASVTRDPVTEEMVLEGGALVMADNGIACIDEFDKMDESDRTAIHEVMEQQTISISKAGITTTLNARTSILAAANPQYGRYNPRMKATENINLPAALLSRFDLLFVILDKQNEEEDHRLARHVAYVHMHGAHPKLEVDAVDMELMRQYIAYARQFNPVLPKDVGAFIVNSYVNLRKNDELKEMQHVSARTLLSVVRMATALARMRFSKEVDLADVDEALRLMEVSKASLTAKEPVKLDPKSAIYDIIREMSRTAEGKMVQEVAFNKVRSRVLAHGFTEEQLNSCINEYERDDMWMVDEEKTNLKWVRVEGEENDDDEEL
ncbi:MCM2/3/5 family-domain-containing protein [Cladochytrium replicatum]|nr:MCM2/3/5 family-domain-containing protein [Cladochytrium replicatum]